MVRRPFVAALAVCTVTLGTVLVLSVATGGGEPPRRVEARAERAEDAPAPSTRSSRAIDALEAPPAAALRDAGARATEPAAPEPRVDASVEPESTPRLSREQQLERIRASREALRGAREQGGSTEFRAALYCALLAIAVELDTRGRGEDALHRQVSLRGRSRGEHRFLTNGNVYAFREDEFRGFSELLAGLETARKADADASEPARHVSDRAWAELDAWTDRAIEHLAR